MNRRAARLEVMAVGAPETGDRIPISSRANGAPVDPASGSNDQRIACWVEQVLADPGANLRSQ